MEKIHLTNLQKYVKQIYTRTYCDYIITDHCFSQDCPFQRASEIRTLCTSIFERQHKEMIKILIHLCKKSTDRYHLNILRIITIIYHIHIECELYNLSYTEKKYCS